MDSIVGDRKLKNTEYIILFLAVLLDLKKYCYANMAQCYLQPDRTSVVDVDHSERGSVVTLALGEAMKEIQSTVTSSLNIAGLEFAAKSKNSGRCSIPGCCFPPPPPLVPREGR
jgi:hypothetical protein